MQADWAVMQTWEGDNTVLMLQTGKYLVKKWKHLQKGKKLSGFLAYLAATDNGKFECRSEQDLLTPQLQLQVT